VGVALGRGVKVIVGVAVVVAEGTNVGVTGEVGVSSGVEVATAVGRNRLQAIWTSARIRHAASRRRGKFHIGILGWLEAPSG